MTSPKVFFDKYMNLLTHRMCNQINIVLSYNILRNREVASILLNCCFLKKNFFNNFRFYNKTEIWYSITLQWFFKKSKLSVRWSSQLERPHLRGTNEFLYLQPGILVLIYQFQRTAARGESYLLKWSWDCTYIFNTNV